MDKATARQIILNGHLKTAPIDNCPWSELADSILVRELSGNESMIYQDEKNLKKAMGYVFSKCIIWAEDKTPVMQELDYQTMLENNGVSALLPLLNQIVELSGLSDKAVQEAKNASVPMGVNGSITN